MNDGYDAAVRLLSLRRHRPVMSLQ